MDKVGNQTARSEERAELQLSGPQSFALKQTAVEKKESDAARQEATYVNSLVREKLQEEIFGRIAKNLKWVETLVDLSLKSWPRKSRRKGLELEDICQLLLEKIHSGENSIAIAFTPILTSLYPHKYEISELFGKYVTNSYEIAKTKQTTALVTEEFWHETYPDDGLGEYSYSERRIVEILIPKKDETPTDFVVLARHAYVAGRNLCANMEELGLQFKDEPYVASFVALLTKRILQIEDALSTLHKLIIKGICGPVEEREHKEKAMDNLLTLKTGRPRERADEKKFAWGAKILLGTPEVVLWESFDEEKVAKDSESQDASKSVQSS